MPAVMPGLLVASFSSGSYSRLVSNGSYTADSSGLKRKAGTTA